MGCSGISWTIRKQSAPRSRQTTTPTPRHSIFTDRVLFLTPNQRRQSIEGYFCKTFCKSGSCLNDAGAYEGDRDGDGVDGQLELKELGDAVVDVATPHDRLDDAREVVVRQDDVRRFLRHVRASNALGVNITATRGYFASRRGSGG